MELEHRIHQYFHMLNDVDKHIANAILQNQTTCKSCSIQQFAQKIHVSQSALTRFAQKIGLQGYKDIKSILRLEKMHAFAHTSDYKQTVVDNYHKVIDSLLKGDNEALFQEIDQANRILIFADGFGMSKVASECKRMFLPLRKKIYYMHGHDMVNGFASLVQSDDFIFIFSMSGDGESVISLAKHMQMKDAKTASITKLSTNPLLALCDYNLFIHALELPTRYHLQFDSCTPFFLFMELLFIQYQVHCEQNFKD